MITNGEIPKKPACEALDLNRSTYYFKNKNQEKNESAVKEEVRQLALESPAYGYRRIAKELARQGKTVNHKKVLRIMKEEKLTVKPKKRFKPATTQSNHGLKIYPNLAKRVVPDAPNELWVADITYIYFLTGFIYLAAIIDRFSRKVVGWALSKNIDAQLAVDALQMALKERAPFGSFEGLIHHSDRGVQYASQAYVQNLKEKGILISMSSTGNAYDNAYAESWMKTFKVEEVYMNEYETFEQAYKDIKNFIEEVYNKKRLHSAIGYVPPQEYEQKQLITAKESFLPVQ